MDLKFCELCEDFRNPELTRYFYDKREVTSPTLEFYVCWDCITNLVLERVQNKRGALERTPPTERLVD